MDYKIRLSQDDFELLSEIIDDWVVDHFESNVDYTAVVSLSKRFEKIKNKK